MCMKNVMIILLGLPFLGAVATISSADKAPMADEQFAQRREEIRKARLAHQVSNPEKKNTVTDADLKQVRNARLEHQEEAAFIKEMCDALDAAALGRKKSKKKANS